MAEATVTKWAILIGVDHYISGTARPGISYHNLNGCVEDVREVEEYLRTSFGLQDPYIRRLTATAPDDDQKEPKEPPLEWPTYGNIIGAFQQVTEEATPGDLVYIHYSGHGARVSTVFDDLKHHDLDEALVPTDISSGGVYVRDVEIAYLLQKMVDKKLVVTLVLDCCHSGDANRGHTDISVRGIRMVDRNKLSGDRFMLSPQEEVCIAWKKSAQNGKRGVKVDDHWQLGAYGYTFLAACRVDEYAAEAKFDNKMLGVFTHFLIETLKASPLQLTYHKLHKLVAGKVRNHNVEQNVVLGGVADRVFFTPDCRELPYAVGIISVNRTEGKTIVQLDAGHAHGLSEDAYIDVWPELCTDFTVSDRLGLLRVIEVDETVSNAVVEWYEASKGQLEPCCLARPRTAAPRRPVQLVQPEPGFQDRGDGAINELQNILKEKNVNLATAPVSAFFRVHLKNGNYVVLDSKDRPLRNIVPPLPIQVKDSAEKLADWMIHLAKYYNILEIENIEIDSSEWLSASIGKKPSVFPSEPRLVKDPPRPFQSRKYHEMDASDELLLKVKNDSGRLLYLTIMNLDSDWAVKQIYPYSSGIDAQTLEPGQTLYLPLRLIIPAGSAQSETIDTIKIFATIEPTSFRWLELPSLGQGESDRGVDIEPKNALEVLQATMMLSKLRKFAAYSPIPTGWCTVQVIVKAPVNKTGALSVT
ncbi:hypothetical protein TWF281_011382 [Arthrobotrys megalospora]